MEIPIVYDNGDENEINIELCCCDCSQSSYGWNEVQYTKMFDYIAQGTQLQVPNSVVDTNSLIDFVKSL